MARKAVKPRTTKATEAPVSRRTPAIIWAMDLARDTRGIVQFLDDVLTTDRDRLELSMNSIDGLGSILRIVDANLLGIARAIDPESDPEHPAPVQLVTV
ncbi:hypothetical protein A7D27_08945 [Pseudomonas sp. 1D4]|uniref:hypothetical protein n=1 Tax=Pseudomonadaceae TaxID=135621 RepID=UPI00084AF85A|nr:MULTISPECIES: hypothetical protein [Pseudomonas]OEC43896.1 hypothetical protein A7D27_08945 [Pseudomonas sp. 1D4]